MAERSVLRLALKDVDAEIHVITSVTGQRCPIEFDFVHKSAGRAVVAANRQELRRGFKVIHQSIVLK